VLHVLTPVGATGLIAVAKPPGMLVIPGTSGPDEGECLRDALAAQLARPVFVVHRLDRDTSGAIIFALDLESTRRASMAFEHGQVKKRYLALVQGVVRGPLDIKLPLIEGRQRKMKVAPAGLMGKESRTLVRPVETFVKASLVECEPLTGRQHQLRVHLMAKGHPLLVDHQYGRRQPLLEKDLGGQGDAVVLGRTPLHAASVEIEAMGFRAEAPLAADLLATLARLRALRPAAP